jgi:hypothetical protein
VTGLTAELAGDGIRVCFVVPADGRRRSWAVSPTVRRSLALSPGHSTMWPVHVEGGPHGTVALQVTCTEGAERWDSHHTLGVPTRPPYRLPAPRLPPDDTADVARSHRYWTEGV